MDLTAIENAALNAAPGLLASIAQQLFQLAMKAAQSPAEQHQAILDEAASAWTAYTSAVASLGPALAADDAEAAAVAAAVPQPVDTGNASQAVTEPPKP